MKAFLDVAAPPGRSGFEHWQHLVSESFQGPVPRAEGSTEGFHAQLRIDAAPGVASCAVRGAAHSVRRERRACGPDAFLLKVARGGLRVRFGEQLFSPGPEDLMLLSNRLPYRFEMDEDFEHLLVVFEREAWGPECALFDRFGYGLLRGGPLTQLLGGLMESAVRLAPVMSGPELAAAALPMAQLAAAAASPREESLARNRVSESLFQRLCTDLRAHLDDPQLTPAVLAARHGISLRYLHKLFAQHELSMMGWLRQERLARCAAELRANGARVQIAALAARWGFEDDASFRRAFRKRYGLSPSAYAQNLS